MRVFANNTRTGGMERGGFRMMHGHRGPGMHMPHHERKALMHIEFDEGDWNLLMKVFGDEDTAMSVVEIIRDSPPEIQIITIQLLKMIEEVA